MRSAILATTLVLLISPVTLAEIVLGGLHFDDNAFADSMTSYAGGWGIIGNAPDLQSALVGSDATNGAYPNNTDGSDYVFLVFDDNVAVNGPGPDIALFEYGAIENDALVAATFNGSTTSVHSKDTTEVVVIPGLGPFPLYVALLDLDDLGIPANGTVNSVKVFPQLTDGYIFTLNTVGALHSIPEPSTLVLLTAGGLGLIRRRRVH